MNSGGTEIRADSAEPIVLDRTLICKLCQVFEYQIFTAEHCTHCHCIASSTESKPFGRVEMMSIMLLSASMAVPVIACQRMEACTDVSHA